jgi:hypothetical protein
VVFAFDGNAWAKQFETADDTMSLVAAADTTHVWAVGSNQTMSNIYFFDGASWSLQHQAEIHLQDVCAFDPTHVWAVGEEKGGASGLYFFDGVSWSRLFGTPASEVLFGVAASGPESVWAVGSAPQAEGGAEHTGGSIFFFDGKTFEKRYETTEELHKAAAVDDEHVWAAGGIGESGPIYFFDGEYWRKQFDGDEPLFDIAAADERNAWAVGGLGGIYTLELEEF